MAGHYSPDVPAACTNLLAMLMCQPCTQVAFVDPPKVDFKLTMPAGKTDSGMLRYMEGFIDAFISDNVLSNYLLPDHYFQPLTDVRPPPHTSCSAPCPAMGPHYSLATRLKSVAHTNDTS